MKKIFYLTTLLMVLALSMCSEKDNAVPEQPVIPPADTAGASIFISIPCVDKVLALGDSLSFIVQAQKEGGDKDLFRVKTSNDLVLNTEVNGDTLTLIAVKQGVTTVTIHTKADEAVAVSFNVTIATSIPISGTENINVDTRLKLFFAEKPVLNTMGEIAIYKKDGTQVDLIKLGDTKNNSTYTSTQTNFIGTSNSNNGGRVRAVSYTPLSVVGNTLHIAPHNGVLEYNTEYYVTISDGAIQGFVGFEPNEWTFKTKESAPTQNEVTVAADGSADFCTVQAAIDYVAAKGKDVAVTINVKNGVYEEMLYMRNKNNVTIKGESRDGVIIKYDNCEGRNSGSGGSAVKPAAGGTLTAGGRSLFLVESCDMLRLESLTIENSHNKTGTGDQAETIYFNSTGRLVVVNCNFYSRQDTILTKGYCWFYNSLIVGDVDFIWGYANICLFENCEIRTRVDIRNGNPVNQDCYVMQARVPSLSDKGYVFLNCNFTKEEGVISTRTYFARSAGQASSYDNIAIINCTLGTHVAAAGWHNNPLPNPATANATSGWKEYGSKDASGSAANVAGRLSTGSYQLTQPEYTSGYATRAAIFSGYSNGTAWMQP